MVVLQTTPLLRRAIDVPAPTWKIWDPFSPGFRVYFLVLLSIIPFAGHFVTNEMSALQQLMLDDTTFPITNTMYGALISAVSVPNMFIPFFGGHVIDSNGQHTILYFLLLICFGHGVATLAMSQSMFWLALVGRIVYGVGAGSAIVGARAMVSAWFSASEMTFAMGVMVAITSIAKMLAKATTAPVSIYFGSYTYGLLYGLLLCILSCLVAICASRYIARLNKIKEESQGIVDPSLVWLQGYVQTVPIKQRQAHSIAGLNLKEFPPMFWILVIMHVVFVNVFHLFQNISSSYLYQVHGYSVIDSGLMSSLSHSLVLFSPLVGLWIDCMGGRIAVILFSAFMGIVAYVLLIFTNVSPVVSLLIISFCLASTPAVLMACVPLTIPKSRFGLAFGISEVFDAVGSTSGNLLVGYLRDATGSYTADMFLFLGLALFLMFLCIVLACLDRKNGNVLSSVVQKQRCVSICEDSDLLVDVAATIQESSSNSEETI